MTKRFSLDDFALDLAAFAESRSKEFVEWSENYSHKEFEGLLRDLRAFVGEEKQKDKEWSND